MDLNSDADFKKIIARRDPRYDGRFYFGVKTTGIYCRPICPAKPKPENIIIFRSPSEAERAGYRACLRCHPDLAPGMKRVDEAERLVSRALRIIHASPNEDITIQTLAEALGVTDRHLRRLFERHLGASPIEILITQRLHLAKQMIQETSAPMTEIAFAVGFQSLRRFNEAFKDGYHTSPSSFRRQGVLGVGGCLSLKIPIRLPYDWGQVLAYLKRHETYGLEDVSENRYRRFVPREKKFGVVTVSHSLGKDHLTAEFLDIPLSDIRVLLSRVKNLFDTDHNPLHLPRSGKRAAQGIRVPGSFDPFETAISIILSQLVSGEGAKLALKKIVCRYGRYIGLYDHHEVFEFPSPRTLAQANVATIGLPKARARAIRELARGVSKGVIDFTATAGLAEMKKRLLGIHGIGPWTATMIAMRCLNDSDAFPEFDLVIQKVLKQNVVDLVAWSSSRAYLTHTIWKEYGRQQETKMIYAYKTMKSPVGELKLVASDKGLAAILWENDDPKRVRLGPVVEDKNHPVLLDVERQLKDYFAGRLKLFSIKLDPAGTDFQKKVWEALLTIPFGETRSYAQIAQQIGKPKAVRAVGAANGKNPLSIIAPCHRVIGSNGQLTGFAGGLGVKASLLGLESK